MNEQTPNVIAVAGDWHGDLPFAASRIMSLGERGINTILHAGDFGIWDGNRGKKYLLTVDRTCARYGVDQILVTPGNHEHWSRLTTLWSNPKRRANGGALLPLRLTEHVTVLPRCHRWELAGRSFVSLGGAPSVDLEYRTEGVDWWPEEMVTSEDVARVATDGYADVFVAHDAPGDPWQTPKVARICATNPMGWSPDALAYAAVGRDRMTAAFEAVAPRLFVHGHYHVSDQTTVALPGRDHATAVWSLNCNGAAGNIRLLDLDTLDDPGWKP